ncbi:MAG TPA: pyridoxal phosphate-dependent aminotransferase [Candidatus Saccharimonadales bacterium]|nr:pyridoxal phosphate-dependent aminotransferase [Candidatus Saccharimonadales bacterium]
MNPRFSERTGWDLRPNRIAVAVGRRRAAGEPILDLTLSNPTRCGLGDDVDSAVILSALRRDEALTYDPDPKGRLDARRAIAELYAGRGVPVGRDRLVLAASTSESYAWIFRVLCDPGDAVLAPLPSYPLFDQLARASDVVLARYPLVEEDGFRIDLRALDHAVTAGTRAVLVVSPGNPTGVFLKEDEREALVELCSRRGLALVCDEVFAEFAIPGGRNPAGRAGTLAGEDRVLTFVLDGISKMLALPQMKLGWIAASGPDEIVHPALDRLEILADTYLSVNTPVQAALPDLLELRERIGERIRSRLAANLQVLRDLLAPPHPAHVLPVEGGWSAIVRVPATRTDEEWALELLEAEGVLVHPGFFFDFPSEGRLVVSLLPEESLFREAATRLARRVEGA